MLTPGADGSEFAGELLLAAVLDGVGARGQDHVELEFLFAGVLDWLGELGGPIRRGSGRSARWRPPPRPGPVPSAGAARMARERGIRAVRKPLNWLDFEDVLDAGGFAGLGGGDHVAGPSFLRGDGARDEDHLAHLVGAGREDEGGAGLGESGEVEEVVLLAEGPIDVVGVVARFGGVEDEYGVIADLVHEGFAAGGEIGHAVALPGGRRRRGDLPDAGVGGEGGDGQGERTEKLGELHRPSGGGFSIIDAAGAQANIP